MAALPLLLGVTGHRDIDPEDIALVTAAVDGLITRIATRWRNTPLVLLSALAEGSDQIVANAAEARGVQVVCPLPMPVADYRHTFSSTSARIEFDRWLERVPHLVLSTREGDGQFRELSSALVTFSHILVAVWDGASGDSPGGTADTVRLRLNGSRSTRSPIDLVYHVHVRRASSAPRSRDTPDDRAEFLTGRTASRALPAASAHLFDELDRFNAALGTFAPGAPGLLRPFIESAQWLETSLGGRPWR